MPRTNATRLLRFGLTCLMLSAAVGGCTARPHEVPPVVAPAPAPPQATKTDNFEATAYSIEGKTASGQHTRDGVVAADPKILPLGSRIRVTGAGTYSGEYTVADTGRTIRGREIDIYIADHAEAKRFGRRNVQVEILELGPRAKAD